MILYWLKTFKDCDGPIGDQLPHSSSGLIALHQCTAQLKMSSLLYVTICLTSTVPRICSCWINYIPRVSSGFLLLDLHAWLFFNLSYVVHFDFRLYTVCEPWQFVTECNDQWGPGGHWHLHCAEWDLRLYLTALWTTDGRTNHYICFNWNNFHENFTGSVSQNLSIISWPFPRVTNPHSPGYEPAFPLIATCLQSCLSPVHRMSHHLFLFSI